jgi:hypothetical protein
MVFSSFFLTPLRVERDVPDAEPELEVCASIHQSNLSSPAGGIGKL